MRLNKRRLACIRTRPNIRFFTQSNHFGKSGGMGILHAENAVPVPHLQCSVSLMFELGEKPGGSQRWTLGVNREEVPRSDLGSTNRSPAGPRVLYWRVSPNIGPMLR